MSIFKIGKQEKGFTLLEMTVVIAIIAILTMLIVTNLSGLSDSNAAKVIQSNSDLVLNTSKSYLLSTSIPKTNELDDKIKIILANEGYSNIGGSKLNYKVVLNTTASGNKEWVIQLQNKIDSALSLNATIKPERNVICVEAISSDGERVNKLMEEGMVDDGSKCK